MAPPVSSTGRHRGARSARLPAWGRRLLLLAFGISSALVIAEIALRAFDLAPLHRNPLHGFHDSDASLGWRGVADYAARFRTQEFDVLIEHDAQGFRRAGVPFEGPEDAPCAVFLGDSFTWGWGVAGGSVFTDRLQAALPHLHVHNRGVTAFGTTQHLLLLREQVLRMRPRTVVLMFCENDVPDCVDPRKGKRPYHSLTDGELALRNHPVSTTFSSWLTDLRRRSLVLSMLGYQSNVLSGAWRTLRDGGPHSDIHLRPPWHYPRAGWPVCAALLGAIKQLCAARRPPVVLRLAYVPMIRDAIGLRPVAGEESKALQSRLQRLCSELDIEFLDLTGAFRTGLQGDGLPGDGTPLFFPGDGHWTAAGHALAANEMLRHWRW